MNVLEWSRHFRCFPGEGTLDVAGVVAATLATGYAGPVSLEVFSDVVREADPALTARNAMRSLIFLADQLGITSQPPAPTSVDAAFLELAGSPNVPSLLESLGFSFAGAHRTKPVTWWCNGNAHVVVNDGPTPPGPAIGVVAMPFSGIAERATALLWPAIDKTRGSGEAHLPGISSPSGLHVFVSAPAGDDDWRRDFTPHAPAPHGGLLGLDHLTVAVPSGRLNEEIAFLRTLLDLDPGTPEEFIEPHGRLRSRAFRPHTGDLRMVLNVEEVGPGWSASAGITQVAFACADVRAQVRALRERGVPLMRVPDNYYVDLDARFGLSPDDLDDLRDHQLLYDRVGDGELLHAFTTPLDIGFHVEVLERRGGYDGYGSAGTHVRLAMQRPMPR
jgi:4-hydroxyphenylpyruvate dioxygenase